MFKNQLRLNQSDLCAIVSRAGELVATKAYPGLRTQKARELAGALAAQVRAGLV